MATTDEAISRMLPSEYRESRDIEQVKRTWNPILRRELGKHWDMIKEGMKGFIQAQDEAVKALAKYERDETAERVFRDFLDDVFPGALDILLQIGPTVNQYPGCSTDEEAMALDDSDARSVTMAPEPSSSSRAGPTTSMGPPPRPSMFTMLITEPLNPATRGKTEASGSGDPGPSSIFDVPVSPPPASPDHGPLTLQQNGKRPLASGSESAQASEMPNKKARKANGAQRTIDLWDVEAVEYIFKDKRCGPGYYVIRCNVERHPPLGHPGVFVKPPLEGTNALDHFNSPGHTCHDTSKQYSIEEIIREFAYRVTGESLTAAKIKASNESLQKYLERVEAEGQAKKSPKGKEKATGTGSRFQARSSIRVGTFDYDDDLFGDEVIKEVISGFLAQSDDVDFEILEDDD
ncbi:hypothetical protein VMCG_04181 [Cytospora schulzeri]|uniref:Uncharacterized protein n=1 Tax=Cytospora schulzeri TaxID=448051 RepID=A0A423WTR6_9PEZI|nr:hypothetical protein VMCG_04181 [Valsa malicola]